MSDNSHAAMCVYCGESIIYDTRKVTDMESAHRQIVYHDQQCPRNPLVARIGVLVEQRDRLKEALRKIDADLEGRNFLGSSNLRDTARAALKECES